MLDELGLPKANSRTLHLAPEKGLSEVLRGPNYEPADFDPSRYPHVKARKIDLTTDAETLPSKHYDLILHSHVLEHVPCDITAVLFHLHRALKDDGWHVFCVPIFQQRTYAEDLGPMDVDHATREFGQHDHVRRWGAADLNRTLGMALRLPETYDLEARVGASKLIAHNIPERDWKGWQSSAVLALRRSDMRLLSI